MVIKGTMEEETFRNLKFMDNFTEPTKREAEYNHEQDCGTGTDDDFRQMESCGYYMEGVALAILGVFAILTNIFTLYIFLRKEAKNSFNLLIVALTCVDLVFCVLLMSDYSFVRAFGLHTVSYTILYPIVIYPAVNITMTASIYMTVVLALERYIAICYPLVHRNISHSYTVTTRVIFYTLPVMVLSILINVPKFLETKVVSESKSKERFATTEEIERFMRLSGFTSTSITEYNPLLRESKPDYVVNNESVLVYDNVTTYSIAVTELRDSELYIKYYMNIFQTMVLGVLPFLALIFFNIKIYHRFMVTRGRFDRSNRGSTQAKDLQLSLILICVICVFVVTNFPRLLLNLYEMFHCDAIIACGDRFVPPVWFICSTAVNHLLLVLNCIMNFVVYCYFNNSFRNTICELCSKWRICKKTNTSAGANNINHNNQFETTKGDKTVDGRETIIEQQASKHKHVTMVLPNDNGSSSHEIKSNVSNPNYPKCEDKKQKQRLIKLAKIACFKSKNSSVRVKRVEILESTHIEMNIISSCNSLKNNINGNTDNDDVDTFHITKNFDVEINDRNFDNTDEHLNLSPLMDSRVTTCTLMSGTIDGEKLDKGSNATIEEISVEISTQECNKQTKESFDSRTNLTSEMKKIENSVVPNLKIGNQYRESQTIENPQIVLDTKQIVNDLEIHSVIKNRCIQTTV